MDEGLVFSTSSCCCAPYLSYSDINYNPQYKWTAPYLVLSLFFPDLPVEVTIEPVALVAAVTAATTVYDHFNHTMAPTASSTPASALSHTRLDQSAAYNHYFPAIVICLFGFYSLVYMFRYIYWHYRRRRKRALWFERGRLRLRWHQMITSHHQQEQQERRLHSPAKERPVTFPSTTTIVCGTETGLYDRPRSVAVMREQRQSFSFSCSASTLSSLRPPPSVLRRSRQRPRQRQKKKHWVYNNKKRRRLMWQWSVAMGYCQYSHGSHMEALISEIQQRDNEKTVTSLQDVKQ